MNKRISYIDIYKGIGILWMIFGHLNNSIGLNHFIGAFNMPMFFLISGFLFSEKEYNFKVTLKKKAINLLIPYFAFGLFYFLIDFCLNFPTPNFNQLLELITDNTHIATGGAVWFLTAFFICNILYIYIYGKRKNYGQKIF